MPFEKELFHTVGVSWADRAALDELDAVLTASGKKERNIFLHHLHMFLARKTLKFVPPDGTVVDFGCGTGRFTRFFAAHTRAVIGTEITIEMLRHAAQIGLPSNTQTVLTDGIGIPVGDSTADLVWVCGVLRYSLNVETPVLRDIAREMYRCLKPGGRVVNLEVYVEQPASDFAREFEAVGFVTEKVAMANWHHRSVERIFQDPRFPSSLLPLAAKATAALRYHFELMPPPSAGIRTYRFVWRKPSR